MPVAPSSQACPAQEHFWHVRTLGAFSLALLRQGFLAVLCAARPRSLAAQSCKIKPTHQHTPSKLELEQKSSTACKATAVTDLEYPDDRMTNAIGECYCQ